MYSKLREQSFKRNVLIDGPYQLNRFNIEVPAATAHRVKKDGTLEEKQSFKLKPGNTYVVATATSINTLKMVFEGQVNPSIASKAHVTLSHTKLCPPDGGSIPVLTVTPTTEFNIIETSYAVRYFTEFTIYPSWDQGAST